MIRVYDVPRSAAAIILVSKSKSRSGDKFSVGSPRLTVVGVLFIARNQLRAFVSAACPMVLVYGLLEREQL